MSPKSLTFPVFSQLEFFWCLYFELLSQFQKHFSPFALHHLILQSAFHSSYPSSHTSEFGSVWMCLICINSHTNLCDRPNEIIGLFGNVGIWLAALDAGLQPPHLCSVRMGRTCGSPWFFLKHRAGCNLELSKAGNMQGVYSVKNEVQSPGKI